MYRGVDQLDDANDPIGDQRIHDYPPWQNSPYKLRCCESAYQTRARSSRFMIISRRTAPTHDTNSAVRLRTPLQMCGVVFSVAVRRAIW